MITNLNVAVAVEDDVLQLQVSMHDVVLWAEHERVSHDNDEQICIFGKTVDNRVCAALG